MKPIAFKPLLLSVAVALPMSQAVAGPFVGNQSDDTNIEVGMSVIPFGPHSYGYAGIGIGTDSFSKAMKVDFQGLASTTAGADGNGVFVIDEPVNEPDHDGLGVFSFAQVGSADVWYGEWSENGDEGYDGRSVFYVGDKANTSMPTTGTAAYAVQGINQYTGGNALVGQFDANFGTAELDGSIENGSLGITVDATISGSSFSGTATAYNAISSATLDANGVSEGEFYGSNAAALAGMATFVNNSKYDTAFGGTKNVD